MSAEIRNNADSVKRATEERNLAVANEQVVQRNLDDITRRLANKVDEFDSLTKDFNSLQERQRSLLNKESQLQSNKVALEAENSRKEVHATELKAAVNDEA